MTHHAPKHVNEPSIWVISKSFTTASSKSSDHFVIQAQVQNSVHHSGHWNLHHNKQRPLLSLYQTTLECFGSSWKKLLHQCGMCPSFSPVRKSLYQRYNSHKTKKPTVSVHRKKFFLLLHPSGQRQEVASMDCPSWLPYPLPVFWKPPWLLPKDLPAAYSHFGCTHDMYQW